MIRINQIKLDILEASDKNLYKKVAGILRINKDDIQTLSIRKRSIDARKKPLLYYTYTVDVALAPKKEQEIIRKNKNKDVSVTPNESYHFPCDCNHELDHRPIIIGMGPAGLFAGYELAKHGYRPIIFERGKNVDERTKDVQTFWETGKLNIHSNVSFGEGGAGTFSDGKLNTLNKDKSGRNLEVLKIFVEHGAPENILYDNKPHVGTDILTNVVKSMRNQMIEWGADIHFESQVTDFDIQNGSLQRICINETSWYECDRVVLAIGHSARDTFYTLNNKDVPMEPKAFAIGMRVQHAQDFIDQNQYGQDYQKYHLPAAPYKITAKTSSGRGVYSFCMCPGGYVVNASSEEGMTVVNGMSYSGRNSGVANSAIIITISPEDFDSNDVLAGVEYQRKLERRAYELGNGNIPVQYYKDFRENTPSFEDPTFPFAVRFKGNIHYTNLRKLLPEQLNTAFIEGMEHFNTTIPGFTKDCLLAGIESRTSSPVRITRDAHMESSIKGLYPCGEGAGYAGGITSAAMDGMAIAETIARSLQI